MAAKTITLDHVYDDYPLYHSMWGRYPDAHATGAVRHAFAAEMLAERFPALHKTGLDIVEVAAGRNEYKEHFKRATPLKINDYIGLDIQPHTEAFGVVVGDALKDDFPKCNVVLDYYYTTCSLATTFEELVTYFTNIRRNLARQDGPGGFVFHAMDDGYRNNFLVFNTEPINYEMGLGLPALMRAELKLKPTDKAHVLFSIKHSYDRWTSIYEEKVTKADVFVNNKLVRQYKVRKPIVFRYWSEPEYMEAVRLAGFDDALFIRSTSTDLSFDHTVLPRVVKADQVEEAMDSDSELGSLMPNTIVAIVNPGKRSQSKARKPR